jgi:hypothetical protein
MSEPKDDGVTRRDLGKLAIGAATAALVGTDDADAQTRTGCPRIIMFSSLRDLCGNDAAFHERLRSVARTTGLRIEWVDGAPLEQLRYAAGEAAERGVPGTQYSPRSSGEDLMNSVGVTFSTIRLLDANHRPVGAAIDRGTQNLLAAIQRATPGSCQAVS